jgi:uncharacterized membrane protein
MGNGKPRRQYIMTTNEQSVDVHAPVRRTYNQWTQFESFPAFMDGVERVRQLGPTMTHWEISIAGVRREFDAAITEQHPDERVAWKSVEGPEHGGVVTFHRLDDDTTRVSLQMEYHPDTLTEKVAALLGAVSMRIKGDLERFKKFIEERGTETGAWRGDVQASPQHDQQHDQPRQADADFAGEHSRPTFADDTPAPEGPDESVPPGYSGMGKP